MLRLSICSSQIESSSKVEYPNSLHFEPCCCRWVLRIISPSGCIAGYNQEWPLEVGVPAIRLGSGPLAVRLSQKTPQPSAFMLARPRYASENSWVGGSLPQSRKTKIDQHLTNLIGHRQPESRAAESSIGHGSSLVPAFLTTTSLAPTSRRHSCRPPLDMRFSGQILI